MKRGTRRGYSLLELVVAIAILGFVVGLAGATMPFARQHPVGEPLQVVSDEAVRTARVVTRNVRSGELQLHIAAYPDGRTIADTTVASGQAR